MTGASYLLVAVVLVTSGAAGCGGGGEATPAGTGETTTEAATTAPAEQDVTEAGATEVAVTGDWLSAGAEAIWLSNPPSREVYRLDPRTGAAVARINVPQGPCAASDFGFGSLWTATCDKPGLAEIDPATNHVSRHLPLGVGAVLDGGEASIAAGEGAVWVVLQGGCSESCAVARIDPRSLEVTARIPVRQGAAAVRAGEGAVWVTNPLKSLVQKIDPTSNRVVATTRVGPAPRFLAVGEGGVWTLNQQDGSVTRLDPPSGKAAATIPAEVVGQGGDITTGGGSVWVRGSGYLLTRVDPETNGVATRYGPSSGSGAVIVGSGATWISAHDVGIVWRLPLPSK